MNDRLKGQQWKNFKLALKRGFTYGLALEIMFVGTGYLLYREYTTNKGKNYFTIDEKFSSWNHSFFVH